MIAREDIVVSEDPDVKRTHCDCCRQVTTRTIGDLHHDDEPLGWYDVTFSEYAAHHPPVFTLHVGDWPKDGTQDTRWEMRVLWHAAGCKLLDWNDPQSDGNRTFTPLGRDDVPGADLAKTLWAMTDAIIMKDTRLQEVHS